MPPMRIVPTLDEVEDRERSFTLRFEAMLHKQFAFERSVEAFAHCVIVGIADRTHRRPHAGFAAPSAERDRRVLTALIRMMDNSIRFAAIDRHIERFENKFGSQVIGHCPTDNAPAVSIEYDGKVQKASPGWDVRDVRNPELVRTIGPEITVDEIGSWSGIATANGCCGRFPSRSAENSAFAHKSRNALPGDRKAIFAKFEMNARAAVRRSRLSMNRFDTVAEQKIRGASLRW